MKILNKGLIQTALKLAEPSILAILNHEGATWGPKWVAGYVMAPGLVKFAFQFNGEGADAEWDPKWGTRDKFFGIARKKLAVAEREKTSTSVVVATRPWCLEEGEFLYPGGAHRDGVSASASGARGRADEAIAEIILSIILMLAHLETDIRVQENKMEI